jgi:hypothetical protein
MVIEQKSGSKGLLHDGRLGDAVKKNLPLIEVGDIKDIAM